MFDVAGTAPPQAAGIFVLVEARERDESGGWGVAAVPLPHEPQHDLEGLAVLEKGQRFRAARALVLAGAPDNRVSLLLPGLGD